MAHNSIAFGRTEVNIFGNVYPNEHIFDRNLLDRMFGGSIPLELQNRPTARKTAKYLRKLGVQALRDSSEAQEVSVIL